MGKSIDICENVPVYIYKKHSYLGISMCHFDAIQLISSELIMTQTDFNCVYLFRPYISSKEALSVTFGGIQYDGSDNPTAPYRVIRAETHPEYQEFYFGDDIGVITVDPPVIFTDLIKPICLPRADEIIPITSRCYVTGFGYIYYLRKFS